MDHNPEETEILRRALELAQDALQKGQDINTQIIPNGPTIGQVIEDALDQGRGMG